MNRLLSSSLVLACIAIFTAAKAAAQQPGASSDHQQLAQFFDPPSDRAAAPEPDGGLGTLEGGEDGAPAAPRSNSRSRKSRTSQQGEAVPTDGQTPPKPKKPVVAQRKVPIPVNAPLPPPRPWGDRDAFTEVETTASTPTPTPAPAPPKNEVASRPDQRAPITPVTPAPPVAVAPPPAAVAAPRQAAPKVVDQAVVILVRGDVTRPEDLQGRKVALGPTGASIDDLRGVVQANAGVTLDPVPLNWTSGLLGLARGEIDGVFLSVGPKMTPEEVTAIALGSYKLLEIPIQKLAN